MNLYDLFVLFNLVNVTVCTEGVCGTPFDIILTNKPRTFYDTSAVTTGLNDCQKLILCCLRAYFKNFSLKKTTCGDYKMFNEAKFLHSIDKEVIKGSFYQQKEAFSVF